MKGQIDEAIVTGVMDYRDSDRIVHLYSREHGRFSGLARGAKRSVKRFGGALELFARVSVNIVPAEGLFTLSGAEPVTIYPGIRTDLDRISHASYAVELLSAITPERLPNARVFRLVTAYLEHLDSCDADPSDRHFYELNLLNILGYRPQLENCSSCGAPFTAAGGGIAEAQGHLLLCCRCSRGGSSISQSGISLLSETMKRGRFGAVRFSREDIPAIDRFMEAFIQSTTGRKLKSLAFIRLSS